MTDTKTPLSQSSALEAMAPARVLVVDDEYILRESCASILASEGHQVTVAAQGGEAAQLLRTGQYDIALLDLHMSDVSGMELLRIAREANHPPVPIIMTGKPTVDSSVEALRAGAADYLPKPFSAMQLQVMVGRASHTASARRRSRDMADGIAAQHGCCEGLTVLGASSVFRKTIEQARGVARTDASVLLTGESGTGKEVIARLIHEHSQRKHRPMIALNCAALPEPLLESEMFGHCKGAFTGAVRDKPGLLEVADGGTLFLDELLEMPLPIQAKLLRVLEDGVVRRLGSTRTDAVVNVRFVAATNRDPASASAAGDLRKDLFYRLSVVPIHVPSLRERPDDIPILARYFLARYWARHRGGGEPIPTFSDECFQDLRERFWPGNVRELENAIERAVVFLSPGVEIKGEDIPSLSVPSESADVAGPGSETLDEPYHDARETVLGEFERRYLRRLFDRAEGKVMRAARIAGVDRTTLYRLMQKRGLRPGFRAMEAD